MSSMLAGLVRNVVRSGVVSLMMLGAVGTTWLAASLPVHAQAYQRMGPGAQSRQTRLDRRELENLISSFSLDETQIAIVEALYDGYRDNYDDQRQRQRREQRSLTEKAQENNDWQSMFRDMSGIRSRYAAEFDALYSAFDTDFRAILTDSQSAQWARYDRDRRRRTTLTRGAILPGERVDIVDLLDALQGTTDPQRQTIEPTLESYSAELDLLLVARDQTRARLDSEMGIIDFADGASIAGQMANPDSTARKLMKEMNERHQAIGAVNERYANIVATQLPGELGQKFLAEFDRRAFPSIFRKNAADRYLERVQQLETLAPDQERNIASVEADYLVRLRSINQQLKTMAQDRAAGAAGNSTSMFHMGGGEGMFTVGSFSDESGTSSMHAAVLTMSVASSDGDDGGSTATQVIEMMPAESIFLSDGGAPFLLDVVGGESEEVKQRRELHGQRRDLIARTIDTLFALLNPQQQADLPKPSRNDQMSQQEKMRKRLREMMENVIIESDGNSIRIQIDSGDEGGGGSN